MLTLTPHPKSLSFRLLHHINSTLNSTTKPQKLSNINNTLNYMALPPFPKHPRLVDSKTPYGMKMSTTLKLTFNPLNTNNTSGKNRLVLSITYRIYNISKPPKPLTIRVKIKLNPTTNTTTLTIPSYAYNRPIYQNLFVEHIKNIYKTMSNKHLTITTHYAIV